MIEEVKKRIDEELASVLDGSTVDLDSMEQTALRTVQRTAFIQGMNYFLSLGEEDE